MDFVTSRTRTPSPPSRNFVDGGPEIPGLVLDAHEKGELVFLCGAGISKSNRLPDFAGLVCEVWHEFERTDIEEVFKTIRDKSVPQSERISKARNILGNDKYEDVLNAILEESYDRAMGFLEGHYGSKQVRGKVQTILKTPESSDTRTHKALLDLATTLEGRLQLVTTNFDLLFEEAQGDVRFHTAPALPVPKRGKWDSVVYLHGRIDQEQDPDGQHLVLTSADFGIAYLTERWASRFVTELFRNFTVVFVGYSLNDPVMRYLVDALAADRRLYGKLTREAFALVPLESDSEKVEEEWVGKNVTPILYGVRNGDRDHSLLHSTLHKWAEEWRGGISSRKNLAFDLGTKDPDSLIDDERKRFLWALSDKDVAAYIADQGRTIHWGWINVLHEAGWLQNVGVIDGKVSVIDAGHNSRNPSSLDGVSRQMARWMASYIIDPDFTRRIISLGPFLHPDFENFIRIDQADDPTLEKIWRVLCTPDVLAPTGVFSNKYIQLSERLKKNEAWTPALRQSFLRALRPVLQFGEIFPFTPQSNNTEHRRVSDITWVDCELVSGYNAALIVKALRERNDVKEILGDLALDVTSLLRQALELLASLDQANASHDPGGVEQPSIAQHDQNRNSRGWTRLIELCRDAFDALLEADRTRAGCLLDEWSAIPYPVFRRLVLYALKQLMQQEDDA